jgi:hypothetical protein
LVQHFAYSVIFYSEKVKHKIITDLGIQIENGTVDARFWLQKKLDLCSESKKAKF